MRFKLYVLFIVILFVSFCDCGQKNDKMERQYNYMKRSKNMKGVEFSNIPRGAMLKLLSGYEQRLKNIIAGRKLKPVFSAQFANNKHTNAFIYPDLMNRMDSNHEPRD